MKFFFFFEVFYCAAIIPIKMSITFMLIRIASRKVIYIYALWVVSAMFIVMNLIAMLYIIFQCTPVSWAWDTSTPGGKCNPAQTLADIYYATTAVNMNPSPAEKKSMIASACTCKVVNAPWLAPLATSDWRRP